MPGMSRGRAFRRMVNFKGRWRALACGEGDGRGKNPGLLRFFTLPTYVQGCLILHFCRSSHKSNYISIVYIVRGVCGSLRKSRLTKMKKMGAQELGAEIVRLEMLKSGKAKINSVPNCGFFPQIKGVYSFFGGWSGLCHGVGRDEK